jgi:hypothetical protein
MAKDKEQDRKDWEAINRHRSAQRAEAQQDEADRQERRAADAYAQEVIGLLGKAEGMTDAELERGIKRVERKTGRKVDNSDKKKLRKAKTKKRRWF